MLSALFSIAVAFLTFMFASSAPAKPWLQSVCAPENDEAGYSCATFQTLLALALEAIPSEESEWLSQISKSNFTCTGRFEMELFKPLRLAGDKAEVHMDFYLRRQGQRVEDQANIFVISWSDLFFPKELGLNASSRDPEVNPAARVLVAIRSRLNSVFSHKDVQKICNLRKQENNR